MLDFEGLCSEAVGGEGRVGLHCGGQSCVAGVAGLDDHELLAGLSVAWVPPTLSKKKCMLELWPVFRVSSGSCSCVQSSLAAELVHPVPEVCNRGEADTETTRARGTTGEGGKECGNAVADGGGGEQRHGGVWSRTHSVSNGCRSGVSVRFEVELEVESSIHFDHWWSDTW